MSARLSVALVSLALLSASPTSAQVFTDADPNQQEPVQQEPVYQDPVYQEPVQQQPVQQQPVQQQPTTQVQAPAEPERLLRQTSVYLTVPIFLSEYRDLVTPGVGIQARFGWEFGLLVPEIGVGIRTNFYRDGYFLGADPVRGDPGEAAQNLNAFWFSLGARIQFLNASRFVPFVGAAAEFTWWGSTSENLATDYVMEPGASVSVGLAIELTQSFGIEAGLKAMVNLNVRDQLGGTQLVLLPTVGGTLYF